MASDMIGVGIEIMDVEIFFRWNADRLLKILKTGGHANLLVCGQELFAQGLFGFAVES